MDVDLGQLREPCACGKAHNIDVEKISIESGAVRELTDILEAFQNPVFICDSNTRAAAEPFLEEEFKDYPIIELDPEEINPDKKTIDKVLKQLEFCERGCTAVCVDILVAIGSGTVHDIAGYCAKKYGIGFISIPTAASMDGYASGVSLIEWRGKKRAFPSATPAWVLADTDILTKAPSCLNAAGMSMLRDNYDALQKDAIPEVCSLDENCEDAVDLVTKALKDVDRDAADISMGDPEGLEKLIYGLIVWGLLRQMTENQQ